MGAIAFQITSLTIVYSTLYSGADQRKHQSSAWLAFVWGIHWGPVNSPHKWPVTRNMVPFDDVIMCTVLVIVPYCTGNGPILRLLWTSTIKYDIIVWNTCVSGRPLMAPDSKVHGVNMGPIWDRQDPGGPHVGPMNLVIWGGIDDSIYHGDNQLLSVLVSIAGVYITCSYSLETGLTDS